MSEADPVGKKESKAEKKSLLSTINKAVTPLMKELSEDQQTLVHNLLQKQMPELALRCAQFFHSISQYCVGYYNNCKDQKLFRYPRRTSEEDQANQEAREIKRSERREKGEEEIINQGRKIKRWRGQTWTTQKTPDSLHNLFSGQKTALCRKIPQYVLNIYSSESFITDQTHSEIVERTEWGREASLPGQSFWRSKEIWRTALLV